MFRRSCKWVVCADQRAKCHGTGGLVTAAPLCTSRRGRAAFTLVELLVVIGIIALLISVLLPVLGRARAVANDTVCESNLRQVTLAMLMYANDYHGLLPPAVYPPNSTTPTPWHVEVWQDVMHTPFSLTDPTGGGTYSYLAHTPFECPCAALSREIDPPNPDGYDSNDHRANGYALNIYLPGSGGQATAQIPGSLTASETALSGESKRPLAVQFLSDAILLADSKNYFMGYFDHGSNENQMSLSFADGGMLSAIGRHGKFRDAWNLGFCDGSVRSLRWADFPQIPANYYLGPSRLSPTQFLAATDIPSTAKRMWLGLDH